MINLKMMVFSLLLTGAAAGYSPVNPDPQGPPGGVSNLGPKSEQDPAFIDPHYRKESGIGLRLGEKTVLYEYLDDAQNSNALQHFSPCGTLMSQFTERGSVRMGRGPVYKKMADVCKSDYSKYIPNDFSVRTYSCENFLYKGHVVGRAQFAFLCGHPGDSVSCSEKRIAEGSAKQDWNCSQICARGKCE